MALLLCTKDAANPFYNEKLDIRLWSLPELCYVIYNYPILIMDDFATPELCSWIREELGLPFLAGKIEQLAASQEEERGEDILMAILQECNYYTQGETEACRRRIRSYRNCGREEYMHALGAAMFRLRRYRSAYDSFREADQAVAEQLRKAGDQRTASGLLLKRAGYLCDMASACVQLFEEKKAEGLLLSAEELCPTERAESLLYLLHANTPGTGEQQEAPSEPETPLTDEKKKELDLRREEAREKARSSQSFQALSEALLLDPVKREKALGELLRKWKKDFRRMN